MATPKEVSLVEISSTFDMIIIIWTLKKKNSMGTFWEKKTSNMAKNFSQVSVGCWIKIIVGNFCLNPDMENHHFNILIQKWK
jgi:hypothetical protein